MTWRHCKNHRERVEELCRKHCPNKGEGPKVREGVGGRKQQSSLSLQGSGRLKLSRLHQQRDKAQHLPTC